MFVFQLQRQRKGEEELTEMQKQFLAAAVAGGIPLPSDQRELASAVSDIAKSFREHGLSDFISTLTPGAQNAIYAASFAWGYENAARYVKSAIKLAEAKGITDSEDMSRAVVENVVKQASDHSEQGSEVSRAVWGFYNEDMKETQVQTARSETLTEKEKEGKEKDKPAVQLPQSAAEAVANGISEQSLSPVLLYCTAGQQAIEQQQVRQAEAQKREEMARLVVQETPVQAASSEKVAAQERLAAEKREEGQKAASEILSLQEKLRSGAFPEELAKSGVSAEVAAAAMQRQQELVRELEKSEKAIKNAVAVLDRMKSEDEERLRRAISSALPPELASLLLHRKEMLLRRLAVKKQLKAWLTFCSGAKAELRGMPAGRLIKLLSVSKLFRF